MTELATIERNAVVAASSATSLLQAITQAASNSQIDIEKMERLFAMHQQMVRAEAEAAFNGAMARAQAKILPVATNAENTHTHSRYAKLEAINRLIVPIYTAEGLAISFNSGECPVQGWQRTVAVVSHAQGHSRTYHLDLPPDAEGAKGNTNKTMVQATGSTNSYARRYLTNMIFNISTYDDNDGNRTPKRTEQEPDPEGQKILEACGSMRALTEAWSKLTEAQRKTLTPVMNVCRKRIREAEQE